MKQTGMLLILFFMLGACGTIAGNPVKPDTGDDGGNPTSLITFDLPALEFDLPSELQEEDATLHLTQFSLATQEDGDGDNKQVARFAQESHKILKGMQKFNDHINRIIDKLEDEGVEPEDRGEELVLLFSGRGDRNEIAGKISQNQQTLELTASICIAGKPIKQLSWNKDQTEVSLVRDFSVAAEDGETSMQLASSIKLTKGEAGTEMAIANFGFGTNEDFSGGEGRGRAERTTFTHDLAGAVTYKSVVDWFTELPDAADASFEGDNYFVGRFVPAAEGRGQTEFLAYQEARTFLCRRGFDEDSATLFAPEIDEPRFCLGRPLGRKKFTDWADFQATAARLKDVGIHKSAELEVVAIDSQASCD